MNSPKKLTGYGTFDLSRQIARRVQREWEMVESPSRQSWPLLAAFSRPVLHPAPMPKEKRPLAA